MSSTSRESVGSNSNSSGSWAKGQRTILKGYPASPLCSRTCHHVGAHGACDLGVGEAALLDLAHVVRAQLLQLLGLQPQLRVVQLAQL